MKKLYSIFMLAVMAIAMSFSAKADITVTLKVDDASRLTGYYQYYDANYSYYEETLDLTQFTGDGNYNRKNEMCSFQKRNVQKL